MLKSKISENSNPGATFQALSCGVYVLSSYTGPSSRSHHIIISDN